MVRWAILLATPLAVSACGRGKPPPPAQTATSPAPVTPPCAPPAPAPPQPAPCDDALVRRVAAGAAPLGELWTRLCGDADKTRALLTARTKPPLTGFVTARRRGTALVPSLDDDSATRVSWQGTCLAPVEEMLPPSSGVVPTTCLSDAEVSEEELPPELNDVRAEFLFGDPAALQRWRACRAETPAETCLDRMLPSGGAGSDRDPVRARWIAARTRAHKGLGLVRRARCRLVMVDRESGMLGFRCRGTLVDAACRGGGDGVTFSGTSPWCAGGTLAEIGWAGTAPAAACLESARAALRADAGSFAAARAAALATCAPGEHGKRGEEPFDEQELDPEVRELIHRLLARQQALFGPVAPPAKNETQVVARGCGNQIWALAEDTSNRGTIGNGRWGRYADERRLVRLPVSAEARESQGSPVYFVGTQAWGDEFRGYRMDRGDEDHTEADLVEETCVARQGNEALCAGYARGYDPSHSVSGLTAEDGQRVAALIARDWPRASRRLARWQLELASGARLNANGGEYQRQTCARLLIDACTGDLGEVCVGKTAEDPSCEGELLPDGRCRQYHFVRLPLLPAQPPAR